MQFDHYYQAPQDGACFFFEHVSPKGGDARGEISDCALFDQRFSRLVFSGARSYSSSIKVSASTTDPKGKAGGHTADVRCPALLYS